MEIKKAKRIQRKLKMNIQGVSGSGKTYTALMIAKEQGEKVLLIDSEHASASIYSNQFDFDILELDNLELDTYFKAIKLASTNNYDCIVIDSASHAWEAVLEEVEKESIRSRGGNTFQAWGKVGTPKYKEFLAEIMSLKSHLICTMRSKSDYIMEEYTDKAGNKKNKPVKIGLAPVFRQGGEYEFDLVVNMDLDHNLIVDKTRFSELDNLIINKPDVKFAKKLKTILEQGEKVVEPLGLPEPEEYYYLFRDIDPTKNEKLQQFLVSLNQAHIINEFILANLICTNQEVKKIAKYKVTKEEAENYLEQFEEHEASKLKSQFESLEANDE